MDPWRPQEGGTALVQDLRVRVVELDRERDQALCEIGPERVWLACSFLAQDQTKSRRRAA